MVLLNSQLGCKSWLRLKSHTATILSPYMILTGGKMVVDKAALAKIEEVFA